MDMISNNALENLDMGLFQMRHVRKLLEIPELSGRLHVVLIHLDYGIRRLAEAQEAMRLMFAEETNIEDIDEDEFLGDSVN